jgi:hypothetical protein
MLLQQGQDLLWNVSISLYLRFRRVQPCSEMIITFSSFAARALSVLVLHNEPSIAGVGKGLRFGAPVWTCL